MPAYDKRPIDWLGLLPVVGIVIAALVFFMTVGHAHEHQAGESEEQARVVQFYKTWLRPKGDFSITHRFSSCCYAMGMQQDCFPVEASRRRADGVLEVLPETGPDHKQFAHWYPIEHGIAENLQPDPRESPDGRSHVCIAEGSQIVVCYVPGYGG